MPAVKATLTRACRVSVRGVGRCDIPPPAVETKVTPATAVMPFAAHHSHRGSVQRLARHRGKGEPVLAAEIVGMREEEGRDRVRDIGENSTCDRLILYSSRLGHDETT